MFPSSYSLASKLPPPKYADFTGYGWIIVTCSFILYLIVDGIAYNLGLINSAWLAEFQQSETATSWIGSIFYSVPLLSAPITAHLVETFGCKTITIVCSIISTFGFVMSSFCGSIEQLYLTVGLIAGFGASAAYVVGILSAERWFEKKRTLAIGIVSSGTGFGTFLIAPITQRLLDAYGWRNVMYFLASLNVLMGVVGCFIREPQWVLEEMEKKGIKIPKASENHGIFEEHETSFGTFRRLSMEAMDDIKDAVRGHFGDHYSHLEEVVEEKGQNFDNFEVELKEPENAGAAANMSDPESKVMSHHKATVPQTSITNSQQAPFRHDIDNIEQQLTANDSQERNNLENNETSHAASTKCHVSYKEIGNEIMTEQLPQAEEDEHYQEENSGLNGDYEALKSIIATKNTSADNEGSRDCDCISKHDVKSKVESDGQIYTISGQNLENKPENLTNEHQICQNHASDGHHSDFDEHSFKYEQPNFKFQHHDIQTESCPEMKQQNGFVESKSTENLKNGKCNHDLGRSLQNPQYQVNHADNPQYTEACYVFQNADTNHTNLTPTKPQISTVILEFIKAKFKVVKQIFTHFSNRDFTLLAISTFAIYSLYNIPIYFIVELLKNYGYTEAQCANYISLIGISILVGMITLGYIGDVSGYQVKNVNALCVLVCGITEILLPSCADNAFLFSICCIVFGFSFASAYVLIPKIAEMIVGVEEFASAIGLNFFVQGLALLVGIPFASTIYEAIGSWKIAFEICGTIISCGSIFAYLVRVDRPRTDRI